MLDPSLLTDDELELIHWGLFEAEDRLMSQGYSEQLFKDVQNSLIEERFKRGLEFKDTNEQLPHDQLAKLVSHLTKTIEKFPWLGGRTISYDYEADSKIISLTWEEGYHTSEDYGDYVLDFNLDRQVIGIELLDFKIEDIPGEPQCQE